MLERWAGHGRFATGVLLIGIGSERLLNSYLLDHWGTISVSMMSGVLSVAVGSIVVGLVVYRNARARRQR